MRLSGQLMLAGGARLSIQSNGGGCSGVFGDVLGVAAAEVAVSQGKHAEGFQIFAQHNKVPPSRTVTPGLAILGTLKQ